VARPHRSIRTAAIREWTPAFASIFSTLRDMGYDRSVSAESCRNPTGFRSHQDHRIPEAIRQTAKGGKPPCLIFKTVSHWLPGPAEASAKTTARLLAERGMLVGVNDYNAEWAENTARELQDAGLGALALPADVSSKG